MHPQVFTDYNGTLIQNPTEGDLWKSVVEKSIFYKALRGRIPTAVNMTRAGFRMKELIADYKAGRTGYDKVYEVLNNDVLAYVPINVVEDFIKAYSRSPETQTRLDERILRPISGREVCVVSTGSRLGIRETIRARNERLYPFASVHVSLIRANDVYDKENGSCFDLSIYSSWHKREALRSIAGADMRKSVFFGDSKDDKPCMELTKERGGHVIAPFFATEQFKQEIAMNYDAYVPETEEGLKRILETLIRAM